MEIGAIEEIYPCEERKREEEEEETLHQQLTTLKPQVISSLTNQTYLSTLHKKLAVLAESLTNLNSLYSYHPSTDLNFNTKETIAIEVANWYTEYRNCHPSECELNERRERNYPLAVLLPVVIDLVTSKQVITIDSPPTPTPSPSEDPLHSITYPKWQGSYNDTFQDNTCPIDNILAILSLNRTSILNALNLIGVIPADTKFHRILSLLEDNKHDELRDYIARRIGLPVNYDSSGLFKSYDFYGSESILINFLRSEDLCNDQYFSTFKCHNCTNIFNTKNTLSSITEVTNLESSLSQKLNPIKCKSCGSTTAIFERLSGNFQSIPTLLTIEIGHLPEPKKDLSISDIDQHFTISHNHLTLHYQLAGFSIFFQNHFYSMLLHNGTFHKYDDLRTPASETWNCNNFYGTVNNVFYLLHSSD